MDIEKVYPCAVPFKMYSVSKKAHKTAFEGITVLVRLEHSNST